MTADAANIAARVAEPVSVTCPVCGVRVEFRPIVTNVTVLSAVDYVRPMLHVGLQPGNRVAHACQEINEGNPNG